MNRRPIARLTRPFGQFVRTEAWAGLVLLAATVVALVWASSPWHLGYESLWRTRVSLRLGPWVLPEDLRHWVDDGLMTLFFFVVGLEIKRELVSGELRNPRKAALPVLGALGGMLVPALVYASVNHGGPGSAGWGIPMATDIAFALAVLTALGPRVPPGLKVFLVSLAIADDVGAIVVIAVFYSAGISWLALGVAAGLLGVVCVLRALGVRWMPAYVVVGAAVWLATLHSGIHATIAGVALALLTPARPLASEPVSPAERLGHVLHPWTGFLVVPLFALANAGIPVSAGAVGSALGSPVGLGVVLGLVVGKPLGVLALTALSARVGMATLPEGVRWRHLCGAAALAGIGFTVSLFVAGLTFPAVGELSRDAKTAILVGSSVSALVGSVVLLAVSRPAREGRARLRR